MSVVALEGMLNPKIMVVAALEEILNLKIGMRASS